MMQLKNRLSHFLRRLAAACYDTLLLLGLLIAGSFAALLFTGGAAIHPHNLWYSAYLWLLGLGFYGWFWTHGGQTLGLRSWKLRVVGVDAQALRWPRAVLRYALAAPCWLSGIGLLWALFDPQCAALHERLSGTRLIRISAKAGPPQ